EGSDSLQGFKKFWAHQNLFLSTNARLRRNRAYWSDEIEPRRSGDKKWPGKSLQQELDERLDEMMQDYATARLMYTLVANPSSRLSDKWVALATVQSRREPRGRATDGLLKVSYRVAADTLDKAAGYMNALFGWGVPEQRVYLATVWHEKGNREKPIL